MRNKSTEDAVAVLAIVGVLLAMAAVVMAIVERNIR